MEGVVLGSLAEAFRRRKAVLLVGWFYFITLEATTSSEKALVPGWKGWGFFFLRPDRGLWQKVSKPGEPVSDLGHCPSAVESSRNLPEHQPVDQHLEGRGVYSLLQPQAGALSETGPSDLAHVGLLIGAVCHHTQIAGSRL